MKQKIEFLGVKNKNENDLNYAKVIKNFKIDNGLKNGYGIKNLTICFDGINEKTYVLPNEVNKILNIYYYKFFSNSSMSYTGVILLYAQTTNNEKKIYWSLVETSLTVFFELSDVSFLSEPIGFNINILGIDYIIFVPTTDEDTLCLWSQNSHYTFQTFPCCTDACLFDGKIYAISKNKPSSLYVTNNETIDDLLSSQFSGESYDFDDDLGKAFKLLVFDGALFVFREKGIIKISSTNALKEGSFKVVSFDFANTFVNTICSADNCILFLREDGLYSFDQVDFLKYEMGFENYISKNNKKAVAAWHNGKYVVALNTTNGNSDTKNNSMIVLDILDKNFCFVTDVSVLRMLAINNENNNALSFCFDYEFENKIGMLCFGSKIFTNDEEKMWQSHAVLLGKEQKVLKSFELFGQGEFCVEFCVDEKTYEFNVSVNKNKKINSNLRGKKVSIKIKTTSSSSWLDDMILEVI